MSSWHKNWGRENKGAPPPPPVTSESLRQAANHPSVVKYGVYNQPAPFAGQTVRTVYLNLYQAWNLPWDAVAFKGRNQLDPDYVIQPGDQIEFHRRMGNKGPTVNWFDDRIRVRYGVYEQTVQRWTTVGALFQQLHSWNIPKDVKAYVDKKEVPLSHKPKAGQIVEFHRTLGSSASPYTPLPSTPSNANPNTTTGTRRRLRAWNGNDNEAELSIGNIFTTRAFRIVNELELASVTNAGGYDFIYKPGVNHAECRYGCGVYDENPLPGVECNCGFYSRKLHTTDYCGTRDGEMVQAITRVSGRVIEGEKGYRSSKIEIVGLIANPYVPLSMWVAITELYKTKLVPDIDIQDPQDLEAILDLVSWNPKGE